jgi:DNA-binding NtrC family response regulator
MKTTRIPRVLLVEDAPDLALLYHDYLRNEPIELEHATSGAAALAEIEAAAPDVLILDLRLPDMDGREVLAHVAKANLSTRVLVITAYGNIDIAVQAMRAGACDFLTKPFEAERLRRTLRETLQRYACAFQPTSRQGDPQDPEYEGFVGASRAMKAVYRTIECAARSQAAVFISGETGTGKELCAQAIHRRSARRTGPFFALNCSAIPKELMESEIFGHTKGAYTGALRTRAGAARLAHGGSLFLDEICEMDPSLQAKLLRFLQSGSFRPLGSDRSETVDVRLICATNREPLEEIATGRLREDLYYRIHVVPLHLLPLRERREDILPIARYFLSSFAHEEDAGFSSFAPEAEAMLEAYDWPGNVRQLQNVVRSVSVLHHGPTITPDMLGPLLDPAMPARHRINGNGGARAPDDSGAVRPLRLMEKDLIEHAIACCGGNVVAAAKLLEISPSTIYRKRVVWERAPIP